MKATWTPELIARLGQVLTRLGREPDKEVARLIGVSAAAVGVKRRELSWGICLPCTYGLVDKFQCLRVVVSVSQFTFMER